MADPVRIVGGRHDGKDSEGIQAQVTADGNLLIEDGGYVYNDVDKTNATYYYYGAVGREGKWFIMRKTVGDPAAYRFATGDSGYALAWTTKETQSYDYSNLRF